MITNVTQYRSITHDSSSHDTDIDEALGESQRFVEQKTNRFFELRDEAGVLIERTEVLKIHRDGLVYPHATPLHSILTPASTTAIGPAVSGAAWPTITSGRGFRYPWFYGTVSVAYTGGFEDADMPDEIVRTVAELAELRLIFSTARSLIPTGATTVHVGDVSFSGKDLSSSAWSTIPEHIRSILTTWKFREV